MRTSMLRRAEPGPAGSAAPRDVAPPAREPGWWRRVRQRLVSPPSPELVLDQLNRQLAVLEGARAELEAGWIQGSWWTIGASDGAPKPAGVPKPADAPRSADVPKPVGAPKPADGLGSVAGGGPDQGDGVCLVGALVRAGSRLPGARAGVGRAVDAVYDALWASRGQPGTPLPGRLPPVPPPEVRLARVRTLTQWNDHAGRARTEVLAVVDRAISATIMDLMSVPYPAAVPGTAVPGTAVPGTAVPGTAVPGTAVPGTARPA